MIAILYDEQGKYIGYNSYLTEEDDIQLPHFFVEEIPKELLSVPKNQQVMIDPQTHEIKYEVILKPDTIQSVEERIAELEKQLADTQMYVTNFCESNLLDKEQINRLQLTLTEIYEKLVNRTSGNSDS